MTDKWTRKVEIGCKLAVNRLMIHKRKKIEASTTHKREVSELLAEGKEERARVRTVAIVFEDFMIDAMNMVQVQCQTIIARKDLFAVQKKKKKCPEELHEAVCSVLFAAPFLEVPELKKLRKGFLSRFGKDFPKFCKKNGCVSPKLIQRLSGRKPEDELVYFYLGEIAERYNVKWTPPKPATPCKKEFAELESVASSPDAASSATQLYTVEVDRFSFADSPYIEPRVLHVDEDKKNVKSMQFPECGSEAPLVPGAGVESPIYPSGGKSQDPFIPVSDQEPFLPEGGVSSPTFPYVGNEESPIPKIGLVRPGGLLFPEEGGGWDDDDDDDDDGVVMFAMGEVRKGELDKVVEMACASGDRGKGQKQVAEIGDIQDFVVRMNKANKLKGKKALLVDLKVTDLPDKWAASLKTSATKVLGRAVENIDLVAGAKSSDGKHVALSFVAASAGTSAGTTAAAQKRHNANLHNKTLRRRSAYATIRVGRSPVKSDTSPFVHVRLKLCIPFFGTPNMDPAEGAKLEGAVPARSADVDWIATGIRSVLRSPYGKRTAQEQQDEEDTGQVTIPRGADLRLQHLVDVFKPALEKHLGREFGNRYEAVQCATSIMDPTTVFASIAVASAASSLPGISPRGQLKKKKSAEQSSTVPSAAAAAAADSCSSSLTPTPKTTKKTKTKKKEHPPTPEPPKLSEAHSPLGDKMHLRRVHEIFEKYKDAPAIVIDNGSGVVKAGMAGEEFPRCVFPSIVGVPQHGAVIPGMAKKSLYIGDEAQQKRGVLALSYPIDHGIVSDWSAMTALWEYTFSNEMRVNPAEHPILLTEAPLNPTRNRYQMAEIMFEHFNVPAYYCAIQAVLALYASGRTTGVVLDCGDGVSHVVPVYEGYSFPHAVHRFNLGGRDLTRSLQQMLMQSGSSLLTSAEFEIVRDIKEKHAYVLPSADAVPSNDTVSYTLPDGQVVQFGDAGERHRCAEALFNPRLLGMDTPGVSELVFKSVAATDIDIRPSLMANVELSGGTTMLPGLEKRLDNDLNALMAKAGWGAKVKIHGQPGNQRKVAVWQGGSILATLPSFGSTWVSREEYEEYGVGIISQKCI